MSPEDSGEFGRYCHYRRSEDPECTALRLRLGDTDARRYEAAFQESQEGRKAV